MSHELFTDPSGQPYSKDPRRRARLTSISRRNIEIRTFGIVRVLSRLGLWTVV